jgi:hypothetical protein
MQDGTGRQRNLVPTSGTLPTPKLHQFIGASVPTTRAYETVRPTARSQVLLASLLSRELRLEFAQGFRKGRPWHPPYTTACGLLKQPYKQKLASPSLAYIRKPAFDLPYLILIDSPARSASSIGTCRLLRRCSSEKLSSPRATACSEPAWERRRRQKR